MIIHSYGSISVLCWPIHSFRIPSQDPWLSQTPFIFVWCTCNVRVDGTAYDHLDITASPRYSPTCNAFMSPFVQQKQQRKDEYINSYMAMFLPESWNQFRCFHALEEAEVDQNRSIIMVLLTSFFAEPEEEKPVPKRLSFIKSKIHLALNALILALWGSYAYGSTCTHSIVRFSVVSFEAYTCRYCLHSRPFCHQRRTHPNGNYWVARTAFRQKDHNSSDVLFVVSRSVELLSSGVRKSITTYHPVSLTYHIISYPIVSCNLLPFLQSSTCVIGVSEYSTQGLNHKRSRRSVIKSHKTIIE